MSNTSAIAVVTECLKARLRWALDLATPKIEHVNVSSARPMAPTDPITTSINVFLYQVTPNAALRNHDLPTRRDNGALAQRPQFACDLHYLLTFTGPEDDFMPQRLLGATLAGLHAHPVLTPDEIDAIATHHDFVGKYSDLARQSERVRFTIADMNLEELSKLWSVFFQTAYQLSLAVQASVVLLEAPLTPAVHRPVARRGIYSHHQDPPVLLALTPTRTSRTTSGARAHVTLTGSSLRGAGTRVALGRLAPVAALTVDDTRVVVELPDDLRAGVHTARVHVAHTLDDAGQLRDFESESNALPFVLEPRVTSVSPVAATTDRVLTLEIEPAVARTQVVRVIVGNHAVPWLPPDASAEFSSLTIRLTATVGGGTYPLRVEVDGATSSLVDPAPTDPPGSPSTPSVAIPAGVSP